MDFGEHAVDQTSASKTKAVDAAALEMTLQEPGVRGLLAGEVQIREEDAVVVAARLKRFAIEVREARQHDLACGPDLAGAGRHGINLP